MNIFLRTEGSEPQATARCSVSLGRGSLARSGRWGEGEPLWIGILDRVEGAFLTLEPTTRSAAPLSFRG
jgi:hypothetical protein